MIRAATEWLFVIAALVLIVLCTTAACAFYAALCLYRVAFRVKWRITA